MKPPPFILFAALLFWGWLSGVPLVGAGMGAVLELARFVPFRWELDNADFKRIWNFCLLLNLALAAYIFTANEEGGGFSALLNGRGTGAAGVATTMWFFRWLPATLLPLVLAQVYDRRQALPLTAISFIARRRRKNDPTAPERLTDISYAYLIVCLFSAGIHPNTGIPVYFFGLGVLSAWALWPLRSQRFGFAAWLAAFALALAIGWLGVLGLNQVNRAIQNLNVEWLSRFFTQRADPLQATTSMGRIGKLKLSARIVIWLEPKSAGSTTAYLREATYRNYRPMSMIWNAGSAMNEFNDIPTEADGSTVTLIPGTNAQSIVNITFRLNGRSGEGLPEGVVPLPDGCQRLEKLPPYMTFRMNKTGALLASGRGLVNCDAIFGGRATIDSPPDSASTNRFDISVPLEETNALRQVITEMNIPPGATFDQKLQAIQGFFSSKFTYSTWQGKEKLAATNATTLSKFLLNSRSGHCEFFATATVLLLRELGIPARYAVGYSVHETSGKGYVVRERDAHAWTLVWREGTRSWENFDTTPGSWQSIEAERTAFMQWFSDLRSWIGLQISKFRWSQGHYRQYIFWSLIPVILGLLYLIIFRRRKKQPGQKKKTAVEAEIIWPGLDSEFYQLEKKLSESSIPRQPGESATEWLERALIEPSLADFRAPLRELLLLHYRHRFDPHGLSAAEREALRREAKALLDSLLRMKK